jgi:hypothetical protein
MGLTQTEKFIDNLLCSSAVKERIIEEKSYIDDNYNTLGSRKYAFTQYRNAVRNSVLTKTDKDIALDILRLNAEETLSYQETYKKKVKSEQDNLKLILDYQSYIKKAEELIKTGRFINSVLGFAALTGRRVAEIACTAKLQLHSPSHLLFEGQLKTKGRGEIGSFVIPCLSSPIEIVNQFKQFRKKHTTYVDNKKSFHNNNSKDLSNRVKKHFSSFVEGEVKTKDLRAIYATISCKTIKENYRQSEQSYIADILGHDENDLTTCNSYIDYTMKD